MQFIFDKNFWDLLASIATTLGFVMLIYTAFVALGQLKETTRTRHLEGILRVYEMIGSQEAREKRRYLYTKLKSRPGHLTPEEREIFEDVCVTYDRIGKLVESGLVPREELFSSHSTIFVRTWKVVEPHVWAHRQIIGGPYATHFEQISKEAEAYFAKHFPNQKIEIVDVWTQSEKSDKSEAAYRLTAMSRDKAQEDQKEQ